MKDFEHLEQRAGAKRAELARWKAEAEMIRARLSQEHGALLPSPLGSVIAGKAIVLAAAATVTTIGLAFAVDVWTPAPLRGAVSSVEHRLLPAVSCPVPPLPTTHPDDAPSRIRTTTHARAVDTCGSFESAPPVDRGAFDRGAAAAALNAVDLASCRTPAIAKSSSGHTKVTFEPSGKVLTVDVDAPPFKGTPAGACIAAKYRTATIPAFSGTTVTVGKSFTL